MSENEPQYKSTEIAHFIFPYINTNYVFFTTPKWNENLVRVDYASAFYVVGITNKETTGAYLIPEGSKWLKGIFWAAMGYIK